MKIYFNPPSPWGEGQAAVLPFRLPPLFQSTLPVGGGTCGNVRGRERNSRFQSTLPVGGGTHAAAASGRLGLISIHPPRGGRDSNAV